MSELTQDKVDESHHICHRTQKLSFDEVKAQDFVGISEEEHITLTDLPTEVMLKDYITDPLFFCCSFLQFFTSAWYLQVLLQICSYLSARLLTQSMRLVSKRLNEILSDDFIWRSRIYKRYKQVYPPIPGIITEYLIISTSGIFVVIF